MLTGTVRDGSGAVLASAIVTITGERLIGGPLTVSTDPAGVYRAAQLPPGSYMVEATATGFQALRRTGVVVNAGAAVVLDLPLEIAGVREAVVIEGRAPMVDVRTASAPVRIDEDLLFNLPVQRNLAAVINLVPGVASDVSFGGSQKSNALFVDGVSLTDPLFQDPLIRFNYNWVQEVHVAALGADAEYGGFTGVAANSVLQSGGNRTSGLAEYWTIRPGWVDRNTSGLSQQLQETFASRQILSWRETSGQLGGPLRLDRLWYFAGLQYLRYDDRPAGFTGPGSRDEREWQWLGKLTSAVTPAMRAQGFLERGRRRVDGEYIDRFTPIEASNDVVMPQTAWQARLTWTVGGAGLVEVRHAGYDSTWREDPHYPNTRSGPSPQYDEVTGVTTGSAWYFFDQQAREHSTAATFSRYLERLGAHDVKMGLEYGSTRVRQEYGHPGGRIYWAELGVPYAVNLWKGEIGRATTARFGVFAQDSWSPLKRATISAGLRIDANRGSVPVKGRVFATTPVSPRVGVAWDVRPEHTTVVRAHYGRYHDAIFSSRIMQADTSELFTSTYALIVGPGELLPIFESPGPPPFAIDPSLGHSRVDQYVVGIDHELTAGVALTAQFIAREFGTFMGLVDTGSAYTTTERRDPGPDGRLGTADDGDSLTVFSLTNPGARSLLYTNPETAFNRYRAFQLVGRKRYSRNWQMQASYTWSRNEGTVGNRWHVNAARFDLGSPGRFVNPNSFINAFGRATFDPTHEAKLLGTIQLPRWGGATLSAVYRYTTGQAWGRRARITGLRQGAELVRMEPQGTRRTPALNRLDVRVEKTLALPGVGRRVGIFIDAFNLTNQGVPDSDVTNAIVDLSGPAFGQPAAWVDPRVVRAAVRFTF